MNNIDIRSILYEISEDKKVYEPGINLIESGIIDSFVFIELFAQLEEYNIFLQPTRIDRKKLETIEGIEELIKEYQK